MGGEKRNLPRKPSRARNIIRIHPSNKLTPALREPAVQGSGYTAIRL